MNFYREQNTEYLLPETKNQLRRTLTELSEAKKQTSEDKS